MKTAERRYSEEKPEIKLDEKQYDKEELISATLGSLIMLVIIGLAAYVVYLQGW